MLVRLPGVARPLLGNFASRMTIHGMIARNWALDEASVWEPTVDCLCDGKPGLHLVEVPLSAYLSGLAWRWGGGSLDLWGRLTAIAFSGAAVVLIYFLARRWHGPRVALVAALVMGFSPASIAYGQGFLLEPSIVFLTLTIFLAFDVWLETRRGWLWLIWVVAFAALLLSKIYMLVLLLPLGGAVWRAATLERRQSCWWSAAGGALLATLPAVVWCTFVFATTHPDHPRAGEIHYSLAYSAGANRWPHPLLLEGTFYGRAMLNLATMVLTPIPLVLALAACFRADWKRHLPWLLSMAALVVLLPRKFHELNYYYLVVLPPLALLVGLGYAWCLERWQPRRVWVGLAMLITLACALRYAVGPAFVTPAEDRGVLAAAAEVQRLAPRGEPIVTMHGSTIDLLYYCDRRGWAVPPEHDSLTETIDDYRRQGARYLALADVDRAERNAACRQLLETFELVRSGDDFRIYRIDAAVAGRPSEGTAAVSCDTSSGVELAERRASSSKPQTPGTR
ncbi:MAG: glycosyltransferase family 39 protein [Pirellulales bacterium]|nr:glycosyltransferase family 39 protein [Pirellulales bacterium]